MRHLWPISLIFIFSFSLTGCAIHRDGQSHETGPIAQGQATQSKQASCSNSDQTRCYGQTSVEKTTDLELPTQTRSNGLIYVVDRRIFDTNSLRFISHSGIGKYESYLAQNIPFKPAENLRKQIDMQYGVLLKHREEAHITVVTPPEFERLSKHLTIETINALAEKTIQSLPYELVCLGLGEVTTNETTMLTFFAVVKSLELTALRDKIEYAYIQAGGTAPAFMTPYRPHITIGFTHRDLHESDGVIKNTTSCVSEIVSGLSPAQ